MKTTIPVIILAAGESSRMQPLCSNEHKGMLKLGGLSLISRTALAVHQAGHQKIIVIINPDTDQNILRSEINSQENSIDLHFVIQHNANGMGDALLSAHEYLTNDHFFVIAPYHFGATKILDQLLELKKPAAVCTTSTSTPWEYGIVSFENDRAVGIIEKPLQGTEPSDQKVQACYLLNQEFLTILKSLQTSQFNFEEALNQLMQESEVGYIQLENPLPSLKYAWDLLDFQSAALNSQSATLINQSANVATTAILDDSQGKIIIESGASIGQYSKIVGPCYIGQNVTVGDFCLIRQSTIEQDTTVGAYTEVVRSVILSNSSLHYGYLADSIIDKNVKIGAGLITANKRLDRKEIFVSKGEKKIPSHRKALGVIVGESAQIGIKVGTMPGVMIGSKSKIFPGTTLFTSTDAEEVIKS